MNNNNICDITMLLEHRSFSYKLYGLREPGPWFNIKMSSYQYRKSHCWDKTVVRSTMGFPILVRWHLILNQGPVRNVVTTLQCVISWFQYALSVYIFWYGTVSISLMIGIASSGNSTSAYVSRDMKIMDMQGRAKNAHKNTTNAKMKYQNLE